MAFNDKTKLAVGLYSMAGAPLWRKHFSREDTITIGQIAQEAHNRIMDGLGRSRMHTLQARVARFFDSDR